MKNTALALGSGGARGLAHIGVLRALEDTGCFRISSIAGSSIGALIGGLYAAGKIDEYANWVSDLALTDIWKLLDFSFARDGLFKGDRIIEQLRDLVGDTQISDLDIPFTAVATDIRKREEVCISTGSMFDAIRASIAIPGFFTPVSHNERLLVDGGLVSPLPLTPLQHLNADFSVVVSLNGNSLQSSPVKSEQTGTEDETRKPFLQWLEKARESLSGRDETEGGTGSITDIFSRSVETMQDRIAHYQLRDFQPDLLLEVPFDACGMLDFHRAEEMIELGYELTVKALSRLRQET